MLRGHYLSGEYAFRMSIMAFSYTMSGRPRSCSHACYRIHSRLATLPSPVPSTRSSRSASTRLVLFGLFLYRPSYPASPPGRLSPIATARPSQGTLLQHPPLHLSHSRLRARPPTLARQQASSRTVAAVLHTNRLGSARQLHRPALPYDAQLSRAARPGGRAPSQ